jgi:hypothetical protein
VAAVPVNFAVMHAVDESCQFFVRFSLHAASEDATAGNGLKTNFVLVVKRISTMTFNMRKRCHFNEIVALIVE